MTVWNWFKATDLPMAWGWELAVLLATPGFSFEQLRTAFRWQPQTVLDEIPQIVQYFADDSWNVREAALENFHSLTPDDGVDWLHAILEMRPKYQASVPLCVTQSLRQLRANGYSLQDIATKFKITKARASQFWMEDRFDPFTGEDKLKCGISL